MFTINKFKNGQNSFVLKNVTIDEILSTIKNGDENLKTILDLRLLGKSSSLYGELKISKLPTFRFNFKFKDKAINDNIIEPTGLIYLDIDDDTLLDTTNPYILASWKSLSETGLGILVKVNGLTKDNFKDNYIAIGNLLGLKLDMNACKPTQQNVLSYDKNLYENKNSIPFQAINKKVSSSIIKEKRKECIEVNDTFLKSNTIRFNNISDYFTENEDEYRIFEKKEKLCIPFIPKIIEEGSRNSIVFFLLSQYALLNTDVNGSFLKAWADIINKYCTKKLSDKELTTVINSVLKKRDEGTLELHYNKERRIIFNPKSDLTAKEKQKTTAVLMGKFKTDKTQQAINDCIDIWIYKNDGSITQKKISDKISKSIATIKRNWSPFKKHVNELNEAFKEELSDSESLVSYTTDHAIEGLKIGSKLINKQIVKEDFDLVKDEEYSDIKFVLWNGQIVYVQKKLVEKWNNNIHKKGLMKRFNKNNSNQFIFDYDVSNRLIE